MDITMTKLILLVKNAASYVKHVLSNQLNALHAI